MLETIMSYKPTTWFGYAHCLHMQTYERNSEKPLDVFLCPAGSCKTLVKCYESMQQKWQHRSQLFYRLKNWWFITRISCKLFQAKEKNFTLTLGGWVSILKRVKSSEILLNKKNNSEKLFSEEGKTLALSEALWDKNILLKLRN